MNKKKCDTNETGSLPIRPCKSLVFNVTGRFIIMFDKTTCQKLDFRGNAKKLIINFFQNGIHVCELIDIRT